MVELTALQDDVQSTLDLIRVAMGGVQQTCRFSIEARKNNTGGTYIVRGLVGMLVNPLTPKTSSSDTRVTSFYIFEESFWTQLYGAVNKLVTGSKLIAQQNGVECRLNYVTPRAEMEKYARILNKSSYTEVTNLMLFTLVVPRMQGQKKLVTKIVQDLQPLAKAFDSFMDMKIEVKIT